jgi:hypothetical protein
LCHIYLVELYLLADLLYYLLTFIILFIIDLNYSTFGLDYSNKLFNFLSFS